MKPNACVLLVGTSFSAVPLYFKLKSYGLQVAVCGALPQDPCHEYADQSFLIDYSDKEALLDLVDKNSFNYIVPSGNDFAYMSCCWVAQQRGFPGYDPWDTAWDFYSKMRFRKCVERLGLPAPRAAPAVVGKPLADYNIPPPVLVKPVDSFSGKGITKIIAPDQFEDAVTKACGSGRLGQALVESYIEGSLHSHSAFVSGGDIVADVFVDEYCTVYPYQVDSSCVSTTISSTTKRQMRGAVKHLAEALDIHDGLIHTQFIVSDDRIYLIELMRRAPGDLYPQLVSMSTGLDYYDLYLSPFVARPMTSRGDSRQKRFIVRHTISSSEPLIVQSVGFALADVRVTCIPLKRSGERLGAAPQDKWGILFAEFETAERMNTVVKDIGKSIVLETSGDH